jgi:PKD repeat protein
MMRTFLSKRAITGAVLAACLASAACTMKSQEAPPLTGPSGLGTSIVITVTPDVLTQDGASQSLVAITARDENGSPLRSLSMRAEIFVDGGRVDFGSLSARNLVTDENGRATLVFTAPRAPAGPSVDSNTTVQIVVTPVGLDFGNTTSRLVTIRLVPPGVVAPPDALRPQFTFIPQTPTDNQDVFFDATSSSSHPNSPITRFSWDFGDGDRSTGATATHQFNSAGTFVATLTVTDSFNRSASTTQVATVSATASPTAAFVDSPAVKREGRQINFNASASTVGTPGRRIVRYKWDFGDGSPVVTTSNAVTSHIFRSAETFSVTLIVTDDAGASSLGVTIQVEVTP